MRKRRMCLFSLKAWRHTSARAGRKLLKHSSGRWLNGENKHEFTLNILKRNSIFLLAEN